MQIVVIEDNISMAKGIAYVLEDAGHAVDVIHDGTQANEFLRNSTAELIILDINLPGTDGIEILKAMRGRKDVRPVILLSARSDTLDRIAGLDAGADDYLAKPFDMAELEARVRALSRRRQRDPVYTESIGALVLDNSARKVTIDGKDFPLPRRELALFEILLKARNRTVSKQIILEKLYGTGADVDDKVVEVYISRLRKRLAAHGVAITVRRGIGYQLEEKTL